MYGSDWSSKPERKGVEAKPWLDGLRRKIFVGDLSDIFSEAVTFDFLKEEIIDVATDRIGSRHDYQLLTKRPKMAVRFAQWLKTEHGLEWPENIWIGTSITNRTTLTRLDDLIRVQAKVRFISLEPQIEDVDLEHWLSDVHWVIIGGESDQGEPGRSFDIAWARHTIEQCREAGVAAFVKQLGSNPTGFKTKAQEAAVRRDHHGGDWSEWPKDIQVREMPDRVTANV